MSVCVCRQLIDTDPVSVYKHVFVKPQIPYTITVRVGYAMTCKCFYGMTGPPTAGGHLGCGLHLCRTAYSRGHIPSKPPSLPFFPPSVQHTLILRTHYHCHGPIVITGHTHSLALL